PRLVGLRQHALDRLGDESLSVADRHDHADERRRHNSVLTARASDDGSRPAWRWTHSTPRAIWDRRASMRWSVPGRAKSELGANATRTSPHDAGRTVVSTSSRAATTAMARSDASRTNA